MADHDIDADTKTADPSAKSEPTKVRRGKPRLKLSGTGGAKRPWFGIAALAIAVLAMAVAVATWFRPTHPSTPSFTEQQTAEAKKSICTAYNSVHQAVITNTHRANPNGNDAVGSLAVASHARLALLGGGLYLRDRLAAAPATPSDLANAVTSMANTIEDLGMGYLSDASNFVLDPMRRDLNSELGQIDALCA